MSGVRGTTTATAFDAEPDSRSDAITGADAVAAAGDADTDAVAHTGTPVYERQPYELHADGDADGRADADADPEAAVPQRQHRELHPDHPPDGRADADADAEAPLYERQQRQLHADGLADTRPDRHADGIADPDPDPDAESLGHTTAGRRRMTGFGPAFAISIAGAAFGIAALAATTYAHPNHRFGLRPLAATLVAASVGAFGASRGLNPEQLAASALVTCAFAIAFARGERGIGSRAFIAVAVALGIVAATIALDGLWLPLAAGVVASLPFGLTALMTEHRERPLFDAMLAALAGLTLGFVSAYLVLFVACLAAVVAGKFRRVATADIEFAPAISAFGAAGLLINVSLQT